MTSTPNSEARLDRIEQLQARTAEQIAANSAAISQLREELHSEIAEVVGMIAIVARSVEENSAQIRENGVYIRALAEQAERDRNQAAIDRESFQTSVRDILAYLQTRYNGHEGGG